MKVTRKRHCWAQPGAKILLLAAFFVLPAAQGIAAEEELAVEEAVILECAKETEADDALEEMICTDSIREEETVAGNDSLPQTEMTENAEVSESGGINGKTEHTQETEIEGMETVGDVDIRQDMTDTDRILAAIAENREVTITVHENIVLDGTIRIPGGNVVKLVAEEGKEITITHASGFVGDLFYVEAGASFYLGTDGGTIVLDNGTRGAEMGTLVTNYGVLKVGANVKICSQSIPCIYNEGEIISSGMEEQNLEAFIYNASEYDLLSDGYEDQTVYPLELATVNIIGDRSFTYDGNEKKPEVQVEIEGLMLMENVDYMVSYRNNQDAGTAEILITACESGMYSGSTTATFLINPAFPAYQVAPQRMAVGSSLAEIAVPDYGTGVKGERIAGRVIWRSSPGGNPMDSGIVLGGGDGEQIVLYWEFRPNEGFANYSAVNGSTVITLYEENNAGTGTSDLNANTDGGAENRNNTMPAGSEVGASSVGVTSGPDTVTILPGGTQSGGTNDQGASGSISVGKESVVTGIGNTASHISPATGDENEIKIWLILMMASFGVIFIYWRQFSR